jgi:N-acetylglucosaminyl-diphospho-decaprenol L-rhamnosyltransferase
VREVPWLLGAALAIRRAAFEEVGGFDTSFFMYYEEVDLCFRLHQAGWHVHFAPVTCITHVGGASTSQMRAEMLVQWFASIRRFYQRHYSRMQLVTLVLVVKAVVFGRLMRDIFRLFITRNPTERIRLTESFTGWRRILLGQTS